MRPLRFGICTDQNIGWEENVERFRRFEALEKVAAELPALRQ